MLFRDMEIIGAPHSRLSRMAFDVLSLPSVIYTYFVTEYILFLNEHTEYIL